MFWGVGGAGPALQLDAGPIRDVPQRELADQLSLVEAIPLPLGREVGQAVEGQSSFRALSCLSLDRLDRAPGRRLRCGHAGGGQRPDGDAETVRKSDFIGLRSLSQIDHGRTSTEL
jgi:hypothetical protein